MVAVVGMRKVSWLVEWEEKHQAFNLNKLIDFVFSASKPAKQNFFQFLLLANKQATSTHTHAHTHAPCLLPPHPPPPHPSALPLQPPVGGGLAFPHGTLDLCRMQN